MDTRNNISFLLLYNYKANKIKGGNYMRRIVLLFIILTLILALAGCGQNPLEKYKEAVERTGNINKGQVSFEVALDSEFNTEGLTNEEIREINYIKSIESNITVKYDEEKKKSIVMVYSNFGGMGFDSEIYQDDDKIFMKMPIEGKYIDLSSMLNMIDMESNIGSGGESLNSFISEDSIQAIKDKWINLLNDDDVVAGKSSLLNTEDGEVKATLFTISLTDEQIKTLFKDVIYILKSDSSFTNMISQSIKNSDQTITVQEIIQEIMDQVNEIEVNDFKYEFYIDIDSYIVESNLEASINYTNSEVGPLKSQHINFKTQNWDIEKEQEFEFPQLTDENTLEMENMNQGLPFMFESYFEFNEMEGK